MGDVSIIARRLSDKYVQYGWSGNGGYYRSVGARLLEWYQDPSDIEYLFSLGQTAMIGQIGSEHGGFHRFETHGLTGEAFWVGTTERELLWIMDIFMIQIISGIIFILVHFGLKFPWN